MRILVLSIAGMMFAAAVASAADLKPGQAAGTYTCNKETVELYHASTYRDVFAGTSTVVVIVSNDKVPTQGWDDGADFMTYRLHHPILGVALWFNPDWKLVRAAYFDQNAMPLGGPEFFDVQLDVTSTNAITGSAKSTAAAAALDDPIALDVTFNATPP